MHSSKCKIQTREKSMFPICKKKKHKSNIVNMIYKHNINYLHYVHYRKIALINSIILKNVANNTLTSEK